MVSLYRTNIEACPVSSIIRGHLRVTQLLEDNYAVGRIGVKRNDFQEDGTSTIHVKTLQVKSE